MCLAVPGKLLSIEGEDVTTRTGVVSFGGAEKQASLAFVPEAKVGDYVLVHAGFAINIVDADEAAQTLEYFRQMGELDELEQAEDSPRADAKAAPRADGK